MKPLRLGLGLVLSLLAHAALLWAPAALFSRLLRPWDTPPVALPIDARLQPVPRPQLPPAHLPRPQAQRPRPTLASAVPSTPAAPVVVAPSTMLPADEAVEARAVQVPPVPAPQQTPPAVPQAPSGVALPRQGRIEFALHRGDQGLKVGRAVHSWRVDGAHYRLTSVTETTGLAALLRPVRMRQSSVGELVGTALQPQAYRSERDDVLVDAATLDAQAHLLRYAGGLQAPLRAGTQDLLSAFYQLGRQPVEGGVELTLTTGRKVETYNFAVLGEEKLLLRFGEVRTWHLKSGGEPGKDATEVWLAPTLRGLPVQIRYSDRNGDTYVQVAEALEFDDNADPVTQNKGTDK